MQSSRERGRIMGRDSGVLPWSLDELTPPSGTNSPGKIIQAARDGAAGDFVAALFAPADNTHVTAAIQAGFTGFDFPSIDLAEMEDPSPAAPLAANAKPSITCQQWAPAEFGAENPDEKHAAPGGGVDLGQYQLQVDALLAEAQARAGLAVEEAQGQAGEMLRQAQAQADEIIQQARQTASEVTSNAYNVGLNLANTETVDLLHTARSIVEEVQAWRDNQFSQGEMMMLRLVIEIAQSIFGDGLPLDPENLGQAFSRALSEAKTLGDLRIYVHPEDAAALGANWSQIQSSLSGQRMDLISSDIIKRGGCFVEGQYGSVDGRVETQLRIVKDTLLSTFATSEAAQS